ncbi:MAG TPA: nuclear transport factor 2 family protein [Cytophagaceae bacterium]|nr:nuclear transport factor 2 family protein [Cytophagaceae bacterium]
MSKTIKLLLMAMLMLSSLSVHSQNKKSRPNQKNNPVMKTENQKTAKELLTAYLENIQHPEMVASLFAEDGAIELPYLASLGGTGRTETPEGIKQMLTGLLQQAPEFKFLNIKYLIETPDQVFGEYEVNCMFNGKPYQQLYMGRLVAENGKIKLIREGMNMYPVLKMNEK